MQYSWLMQGHELQAAVKRAKQGGQCRAGGAGRGGSDGHARELCRE